MAYYLSFDGGGSKLNGMMFDDDMRLVARGASGGISRTQATADDVRGNIRDCLDQLLSSFTPPKIEAMYTTGVGDFRLLNAEAGERLSVGRFEPIGEAQGGLFAGALKKYGVLALSGTGSDVFYIGPDRRVTVGAWGPILGDDGSGVWIGQAAIRAVVRYLNGWGEETLLYPLIREAWHLEKDWDMVTIVHSSPAPLRQVGTLTRVVGEAARRGDKVALDVLRQAGHLMAVQTESLFRRAALREDELNVTLCGGAWKAHPAMFETFCDELKANHPLFEAHRPIFEHVMAGPVKLMLDQGAAREEILSRLSAAFPMYRVEG